MPETTTNSDGHRDAMAWIANAGRQVLAGTVPESGWDLLDILSDYTEAYADYRIMLASLPDWPIDDADDRMVDAQAALNATYRRLMRECGTRPEAAAVRRHLQNDPTLEQAIAIRDYLREVRSDPTIAHDRDDRLIDREIEANAHAPAPIDQRAEDEDA